MGRGAGWAPGPAAADGRPALDRRLQGRIDPSDVIQDAYLEAARRLPEYLRESAPMPLFLWLRFLTAQALQALHRRHLARRPGTPVARSRSAAAAFPRRPPRHWPHNSWATTPAQRSRHPCRAEARLEEALNCMDPLDREVLALRHFEQLSNAEYARVSLSESAATKR